MNDTIKKVINDLLDLEESKLVSEFRVNTSYVNPTVSRTLEEKIGELKNQAV